jgi:hypothetical protein
MTRDEAIKLLAVHLPPMSEGYYGKLVDAFAALGMLKLDEPKREPQFSLMEAVRLCRSAYLESDAFVRGLEQHGYRIVEK